MKIAYCLIGYPAYTCRISKYSSILENPKIIETSYDSLKKYILPNNELDIFIHTWHSLLSDKYLETFKPKDHIIELQPDLVNTNFEDTLFKTREIQQSIYIRHYAFAKLFKLISKYKEDYDLFIVTRPDIMWFNDFHFHAFNPKKFHISDWIKFIRPDYTALPTKELYKLYLDENYVKQCNTAYAGYPANFSINDIVFAIGKPFIESFASIYESLPEIITAIKTNEFVKVSNHLIIGVYLYLNKILENKEVKFSFKYLRDYTLTRYYVQAMELKQTL